MLQRSENSIAILFSKILDFIAFLKRMSNYITKLMQSRVHVIRRQKYIKNNADIIFLN